MDMLQAPSPRPNNDETLSRSPVSDSERSNLVDLLALYLADEPTQLAALVADVRPDELPRVMRQLKSHGREAATAVRQQLITVSRGDGPPAASDSLTDEATLGVLSEHGGFATPVAAMVQATMSAPRTAVSASATNLAPSSCATACPRTGSRAHSRNVSQPRTEAKAAA